MTSIASTTGLALTLVAGVPSAIVSPPLIWGTFAVWTLVAGLLAALTGIVTSTRRESAAETNRPAPDRRTPAAACWASAH
jgi:hypothetical protein